MRASSCEGGRAEKAQTLKCSTPASKLYGKSCREGFEGFSGREEYENLSKGERRRKKKKKKRKKPTYVFPPDDFRGRVCWGSPRDLSPVLFCDR
jgi:hypothetical protein